MTTQGTKVWEEARESEWFDFLVGPYPPLIVPLSTRKLSLQGELLVCIKQTGGREVVISGVCCSWTRWDRSLQVAIVIPLERAWKTTPK